MSGAPATELVGPKGYEHLWHYVGGPGLPRIPPGRVAHKFNAQRALKRIRAAQAKAGGPRPRPKTDISKLPRVSSSFDREKALNAIRRAKVRSRHKQLGIAYANAGPALELARHVPIDPKIKLGTGGRFKKMKAKLAARGARNPGALAAYIGRRAYGAKKFGQLSHHAHANVTPALELAMRYPKYPVTSPYDVMVIRGDDGSAIVRHRRGGYEIARIRRTETGSWVASADGRDLSPHTRQRGALLEAIGTHNKTSGTPYHRAERTEPLQPPAEQTPLMAAYGITNVRALATPTRGASDGPRVTGSGPAADVAGLQPRGATIYKKLRKRNFPHERAHAFARRAQNRVGGK